MSNDREELDKHVRKLIHLWNPEIHRLLSEKEKKGAIFIILSHLIYCYGRKKGVEVPDIIELDKSCDSIIRSVDFWQFAILNYGIDINPDFCYDFDNATFSVVKNKGVLLMEGNNTRGLSGLFC